MAALQQPVGGGIDIHPFGTVFHRLQHLQPLSQRSRKGIHQPDLALGELLSQRDRCDAGGGIAAADAPGHPHEQDIPAFGQQRGKAVNVPLRLHQ